MSCVFRLCLGLLILLTPVLVHAAYLDVPGNDSTLSGIGVISGWKCEATAITVVIDDGTPIAMLHGSERGDTRGACGDTNNGFLAIFNYALLDEGEHTAVAYDNGEEFARRTFMVGSLGEEYVRGASAEVWVEDFPSPGERTLLVWNESSQHFEVAPEPASGFAPVDQAAFDRLVAGKRIVDVFDSENYFEFTSATRFNYYFHGPELSGTYRYSQTGPHTGTVTITANNGESCRYDATFTSATTGTAQWNCDNGSQGEVRWRIE